ncbi:MAG: hypothetical protein JNM66_21840 [Bryobacterales bacterium]|nr:hypothetical protein [Bryobacterales bacterium]
MPYTVPTSVRMAALAVAGLLSLVVVLAESPAAWGTALVLLALTLLALEGPALTAGMEDDSE